VLLLYPDGIGAVRMISADPESGMRPQLFVPGGTFHMSPIHGRVGCALLGPSERPEAEPPDLAAATWDEILVRFPVMHDAINDFMPVAAAASGGE
jgi:uncharacterized protein